MVLKKDTNNKVNKTNKTSKKGSNKTKKDLSKKGSNKGSSKKGSSKKGSNKGSNKINRNLSRADIIANPNLLPKYLQDVITMPIIEKSIFDTPLDIKFSSTIDYPKSSIGFQHFIHAMKNDAQKELATFENKKKVYKVLNPFELSIDNYNESINDKGKKYFNLNNKTINSDDFYKLWEMFFMFDLINLESEFTSAHLGDSNSFTESSRLRVSIS